MGLKCCHIALLLLVPVLVLVLVRTVTGRLLVALHCALHHIILPRQNPLPRGYVIKLRSALVPTSTTNRLGA